jgi:GNAT superfamily N-acetyltransferase
VSQALSQGSGHPGPRRPRPAPVARLRAVRGRGVSRRVVPLEADHLTLVDDDDHLASCLAWQLDAVHRARVDEPDLPARKQQWLRDVESAWGSCGRTVLRGEEPVGVAIYAPAAWLPGTTSHPTAPASPDAVVLATLYVAPEHRGGGLARMLVQGVARDLVERYPPRRRGGPPLALETFADARGDAPCLLPQEVCDRLGFVVHRPHPRTPRMRMDLRSTVTWRSEVGHAVGRLAGAVRPRPHPAPAPQGPLRRAAPASRR